MTKNSKVSQDLPDTVANSVLVGYRSTGIGLFGVVMRFTGMPLEKIALFMNSSQVTGKNQFRKSIRLTFQDGFLTPYRVVGPSSITAWFLQYSIMGFAFQFFDRALSKMVGVEPVCYGQDLMKPPNDTEAERSAGYKVKYLGKTLLVPVLTGGLESWVSNRAEVQRYFGVDKFARIQSRINANPIIRSAGPAFLANTMRNIIMCNTTFVITPMTYKRFFPQEQKNRSSLFWYGLSMNIFLGNVVAITQQALWGQSLDYYAQHNGRIRYKEVIHEGLQRDGFKAFFTPAKWSSRVLMNAPAQGVLPWFYHEILPSGEDTILGAAKAVYCSPSQIHESLLTERSNHSRRK